jgi:hypothetical protein
VWQLCFATDSWVPTRGILFAQKLKNVNPWTVFGGPSTFQNIKGFFVHKRKVLGSKLFSTMVYNIYMYGTQAMGPYMIYSVGCAIGPSGLGDLKFKNKINKLPSLIDGVCCHVRSRVFFFPFCNV